MKIKCVGVSSVMSSGEVYPGFTIGKVYDAGIDYCPILGTESVHVIDDDGDERYLSLMINELGFEVIND